MILGSGIKYNSRNSIPITGKAENYSIKLSHGFAATNLIWLMAITIKKTKCFFFSNEENILRRWREYFEDLLNEVTIVPLETQEVHLKIKNTITALKIFLTIKILKDLWMKSDLNGRCLVA